MLYLNFVHMRTAATDSTVYKTECVLCDSCWSIILRNISHNIFLVSLNNMHFIGFRSLPRRKGFQGGLVRIGSPVNSSVNLEKLCQQKKKSFPP